MDIFDFGEVWQYGSNESEDQVYEQDGVAPQCGVPGLQFDNDDPGYGRIPFLGDPAHKNFVMAHLGANYGWVVDLSEIGRVKQRN